MNENSQYEYRDADPAWGNQYLWPPLCQLLQARLQPGAKIFDLGCGNGAIAGEMARLGFQVTAVDPSESGIEQAVAGNSQVTFAVASAYDDLASRFGQFDAVVSLEVVEHCYWPRKFAACVASLLRPGGTALVSTPYHGYLKNLVLALTGKLEAHWDPLWDGGHIKFWSKSSLTQLLSEQGLTPNAIHCVGRIAPLAKSMIAEATRSSPKK